MTAQWRKSLDLVAPPGSLFLLVFDLPGNGFTLPGVGTFATSLGLAPSFGVVVDGLGVFQPANQTAIVPWNLTFPVPAIFQGLAFNLEAFVPSAQAANGSFLITNRLQLQL